jgi:hypothetical protein
MMSDVRVTFPDGRVRDLVQKAYPVGRYIVAGFAGSVKIGFEPFFFTDDEVADLRCYLAFPFFVDFFLPRELFFCPADRNPPITTEV